MGTRASARDDVKTFGRGVVPFDVRRVSACLWIATAIVLGLGILREFTVHFLGTATVLRDLRHFALDSEHSLPAWYESLTMAMASALLAIIAVLARHRDARNRAAWTLLAVVFLLMSIDESVSFHEVTITPLRNAFHLSGFLYFSWVVLAAPVLIVLSIIFIPFLLRLPRHTAARFAIAGGLFVGGAFGLEFVGGYFVSTGGFESVPYKIAATCEESLEIIGMTLFVTSLLRHLAETAPVLHIAMRGSAQPPLNPWCEPATGQFPGTPSAASAGPGRT